MAVCGVVSAGCRYNAGIVGWRIPSGTIPSGTIYRGTFGIRCTSQSPLLLFCVRSLCSATFYGTALAVRCHVRSGSEVKTGRVEQWCTIPPFRHAQKRGLVSNGLYSYLFLLKNDPSLIPSRVFSRENPTNVVSSLHCCLEPDGLGMGAALLRRTIVNRTCGIHKTYIVNHFY